MVDLPILCIPKWSAWKTQLPTDWLSFRREKTQPLSDTEIAILTAWCNPQPSVCWGRYYAEKHKVCEQAPHWVVVSPLTAVAQALGIHFRWNSAASNHWWEPWLSALPMTNILCHYPLANSNHLLIGCQDIPSSPAVPPWHLNPYLEQLPMATHPCHWERWRLEAELFFSSAKTDYTIQSLLFWGYDGIVIESGSVSFADSEGFLPATLDNHQVWLYHGFRTTFTEQTVNPWHDLKTWMKKQHISSDKLLIFDGTNIGKKSVWGWWKSHFFK